MATDRMTGSKTEIALCLGSACFARGNNRTRKIIEDYIRVHGLFDKVVFKGGRCFNHCQTGPVLLINNVVFEQVTEHNIQGILDAAFTGED